MDLLQHYVLSVLKPQWGCRVLPTCRLQRCTHTSSGDGEMFLRQDLLDNTTPKTNEQQRLMGAVCFTFNILTCELGTADAVSFPWAQKLGGEQKASSRIIFNLNELIRFLGTKNGFERELPHYSLL